MQGFIGIDKILQFKHHIVALCFLVSMGGGGGDETHSIMVTVVFLIIDLLTTANRKKRSVMKLYCIYF